MTYIPKAPPPDEINNSELNPWSVFLKGASILGAIVLVCYFLSGYMVSALTYVTPYSWEIQLGKLVHKKMFLSRKSHPRLDAVLKSLKVELGESNSNFYIVEDPSENAFAAPGGNVYFTRAFLDAAESDNEVLFVLGHELGHQKYRHPLKSMYTNLFIQFVLAFLGGGDSLSDFAVRMTGLSFSREQEVEADLYGLELVQKISGHTKGAFNFFERMHKKNKDGFLNKASSAVFSTHPLSKDRIKWLQEACFERFEEHSCNLSGDATGI